jgi:N-acetylglucosaminyl-diphospho-decaprenol L-rhamnosyltransferase
MMHPPLLTAILVTFNSAQVLVRGLQALASQGVQLVIVDNASDDESVQIARDFGAHVIENTRNQGYGRANNQGVRTALTPYVLIVNPDVEMDEGSVEALLECAQRYPEAGIIAPQIREPSGRIFFQPRSMLSRMLTNPQGVLHVPEGEACTPFVSGACMLMKRDLFLGMGGFDEHIFLFYEDDDLCRRMMDAGHAVIFCPEAKALHLRGKSTAPAKGRVYKSRWHQAWSRAYVAHKYGLSNPAWRDVLINAPKALGACLLFQRSLIERYGGTFAGAMAALCKCSALVQEGLDKDDR